MPEFEGQGRLTANNILFINNLLGGIHLSAVGTKYSDDDANAQHMEVPQGESEIQSLENQFEIPLIDLGGADRLNFDYSGVAVKSRCVAEN